MQTFKNNLNKLNFFGTQFQFLIMGKNKITSYLGLFMSGCCLTMVFITISLFGKDFFYKESPKIVSENIKANDFKQIILKPEHLTIAFRIEDIIGNSAVEVLQYISINLELNINVLNSTTLVKDDFTFSLKPVPCTMELAPDILFNKGKNLAEYYCINFPSEGFEFGGSFSADFNKYFYLSLSNCDLDGNCKAINEVIDFFTGQYYYFNIYYPSFYFLPNQPNPQRIKYETYYTQISPSLFKEDTIFFKEYILEDDIGWIFKSVVVSSVLAFDKVEKHISINNFEGKENEMYKFNALILSYNSDFDKIYRSYMKIQELSALVGGFMKIIMFVAGIIVTPYNKYLMKFNLINEFFDSGLKRDKTNKLLFSNSDHMSKIKLHPIINAKADFMKEKYKEKKIFHQVNNYTNNKIELNNKTNLTPPRKRSDFTIKNKISNEGYYSQKVFDQTISQINRNKFDINYFKYLKSFVFKSNDPSVKEFNIACNLLNKKLDIATYMKVTRQFESMKHLFLNYYQDYSLNFIVKPNISDKDDMELADLSLFDSNVITEEKKLAIVTHFNEMICYYIQKTSDNTISEIDQKLIENFEKPIREYINTASTELKIKGE